MDNCVQRRGMPSRVQPHEETVQPSPWWDLPGQVRRHGGHGEPRADKPPPTSVGIQVRRLWPPFHSPSPVTISIVDYAYHNHRQINRNTDVPSIFDIFPLFSAFRVSVQSPNGGWIYTGCSEPVPAFKGNSIKTFGYGRRSRASTLKFSSTSQISTSRTSSWASCAAISAAR